MRRAKVIASFGLLALLLSLRSASAQPQGVSGCPGSDQNNVCTGSGDDRDYGLVAGGVVRMKITRSGAVTFPGALTVTFPASVLGQVLHADGTASAPSIAFVNKTNTGIYLGSNTTMVWSHNGNESGALYTDLILRNTSSVSWASGAPSSTAQDTFLTRPAAGKVAITGTTPMLLLGGITSSFPALKRNGQAVEIRVADDSAGSFGIATAWQATTGFSFSNYLFLATAPTISSGFGTSPAILSSNGSATFRVNVGTGGAATSGVIGLPTAATGWNCQVTDMTNNTVTRETASTTASVTVTAAAAWAASDTLIFNCAAY